MGLVLDSLDDIHCITESKHKDQVLGKSRLVKLFNFQKLRGVEIYLDQIDLAGFNSHKTETTQRHLSL